MNTEAITIRERNIKRPDLSFYVGNTLVTPDCVYDVCVNGRAFTTRAQLSEARKVRDYCIKNNSFNHKNASKAK